MFWREDQSINPRIRRTR